MKAKEIIEKLLEKYSLSEIGHEDINSKETKEEFGEFEYLLAGDRSSDGDHDSCFSVIHFKEHDIYIMLEGYYSSEGGCDFEDCDLEQCWPKTKTVTYYSTNQED